MSRTTEEYLKAQEAQAEPKVVHTEAPASATVKIKSSNGFEYLFTMRDEKASNLLYKMRVMEAKFIELNYTPVANGGGYPKREEKPKKECPAHKGVMMTEKERNGEKFFSHSKGVYPNFGEWCNGKGYPSEMTQQSQSNEEYDF